MLGRRRIWWTNIKSTLGQLNVLCLLGRPLPIAGLANCRYVAHQSDRQGQNAPKGYIARQEMTPEIANIHVGRLHKEMV